MRLASFALMLALVPLGACNDATQSTTPDQGGPGTDGGDGGPVIGPDGGSPDLPPAQPGWQSGFNLPGLMGSIGAQVYALARGENGHVFAGGSFLDAAGTPVRNVAEWNGSAWSALGEGVADDVLALAVGPDGKLYAGTRAPTGGKGHLHRWDGSAWSEVSGELDGDVRTLAAQDTRLLVGGRFTDVGGAGAAYLAAYTPGSDSWAKVGASGADGEVATIVVEDAQHLCVGGAFTEIGGAALTAVACWDGSAWSALGEALEGTVSRLAHGADGTWYAGGTGTIVADDFAPHCIRALRAGKWEVIGLDVELGTSTEVRALAFDHDGALLVGGDFGYASQERAESLARYDAASDKFTELGGGVRNDLGVFVTAGVHDLLVGDDGAIFVAGLFSSTNHGTIEAANIARLSGTTWSPLAARPGFGVPGFINDLALDAQGRVIAGGLFPQVGGVASRNIARFDGTGWSALGAGLPGKVVRVFVRKSGDVLAGGEFDGFLQRWDGTSWSPLGGGDGLDGPVQGIAEDAQGTLYIAGDFLSAGAVTLNHVARWDGAAWQPLGDGLDDSVYGLAVDGAGKLVATGLFEQAGAVKVHRLASWDGSAWSGFGAGLEGTIAYGTHVIADGNGFLVSGNFDSVDGHPVSSLARWDGTTFSDAGQGLAKWQSTLLVQTVTKAGDQLFAGGIFTLPDGSPSSAIGWFDGTSWRGLGAGTDDVVDAIAVSDATVWAGGVFLTAGGKVSVGLAAWNR